MLPLEIQNTFVPALRASSVFLPQLNTLRETHHVIYFEHLGGFEAYTMARDYMNQMYKSHGDNALYIVNVGMEPWFSEWMEVKHEFDNYENIHFWHSVAGPLTQSCDKNWYYIPYWKKFIDIQLSQEGNVPTDVRLRREQIVPQKSRMFFWMRRHYTYRVALLKRLVNDNLRMEIRCPHVWTELERPDKNEELSIHFDNWKKIRHKIISEGQDLVEGQNGASVDSYKAREKFQIEIVSETRVNGGPLTTFSSEKTFRTLRSGNIGLYWAQQHHITNLKRKGWRFYDKYIDHSYDLERDPLRRLNRLHEEIRRLYHMDADKWQEIWYNTTKDREHNQRWSLHVDAGINKFLKRIHAKAT